MKAQLDETGDLHISGILAFWVPLALMWLMMGVEQPGLAAVIARLPEPEDNLAIFGVCFSLAVFIESPILQLLSAATALAGSPGNYRRLLKFMHILAVGLTSIHLIVALTPLFDFILYTLLGVPEDLIPGARPAFLVMTPFAATVGYRRLWQGTLIRAGKTAIIPATMVIRLVASAGALAAAAMSGIFSGAVTASLAIIVGVVVGAVVSGIFCIGIFKGQENKERHESRTISWKGLVQFYGPLAMTSIVFLAARPLLTFGMTRASFPRQSLAVWPALYGFMFLFSSVAISYQEAAIALLARYPGRRHRLGRFALTAAACLSGFFLFAALPPLREFWFGTVAGLDEELRRFIPVPLVILAAAPFQAFMKSWLRGRFVHAGRTVPMTIGVVIYTVSMLVILLILPAVTLMNGVMLAAIVTVVGQGLENMYLRSRLVSIESKAAVQESAVRYP